MSKQKIILLLIGLSTLGSFIAPQISHAEESCCVCTVIATKEKSAPGTPTNGSCAQYLDVTTKTVAGEIVETSNNSCEVTEGNCVAWQEKFKNESEQNAADAYKRQFVIPQLQVGIPGLDKFGPPTEIAVGERKYYFVTWLGEYLGGIYRFAVGAGAVLAVIVIMVGGFLWLTSAGNQTAVTTAKSYIFGAIIGLMILLSSYLILKIVSPALVNLQPIRLAKIEFEDLTASISDDELQAYSQQLGGSYTPPKAVAGMTTFNAPNGQGLTLSNTIANDVQQILQQIHSQGFPLSFGGASSYRPTSNCVKKPNFSWHGCGLAIDVNPAENPCPCCYQEGKKWTDCKGAGSDWKPGKTPGAVTKQVVDAFKAKGFCWGGDWCDFKDFMHFSKPTNAGSKECAGSANYCPWVW